MYDCGWRRWLGGVRRSLKGAGKRGKHPSRLFRVRLWLELLETRLVPASASQLSLTEFTSVAFVPGLLTPVPNGVLLDTSGNLYGTTNYGGTNNVGSIFELVKGTSTITTLASFGGTLAAGTDPTGLIMDTSGNFYGSSYKGSASNDGTVFELKKGSSTVTKANGGTGSRNT